MIVRRRVMHRFWSLVSEAFGCGGKMLATIMHFGDDFVCEKRYWSSQRVHRAGGGDGLLAEIFLLFFRFLFHLFCFWPEIRPLILFSGAPPLPCLLPLCPLLVCTVYTGRHAYTVCVYAVYNIRKGVLLIVLCEACRSTCVTFLEYVGVCILS